MSKNANNTQKRAEAALGKTGASFIPQGTEAPLRSQTEREIINTLAMFSNTMKDIEKQKAEKEKIKTLAGTAHIAREINRQSSLAQSKKMSRAELLKMMAADKGLSRKELEQAIIVQSGENVLAAIEEGIEEGELASKVIIALAITLYEQSEIFGTLSDLRGATEKLLPLLDMKTARVGGTPGRKEGIEETLEDGSKVLKAEVVESYCPIVLIEITAFTRLVLGKKNVNSTDKKRVRAVLDTLRKKTLYLLTADRSNMISCTIIGKQRGAFDIAYTANKEGQKVSVITEKYRAIELDAVFTKNVLKDFAVIRKDTLKLLSGRQSLLTMKLLHVLLEQYSYHKEGGKYSIYKKNLLDRIAVAKRYKEHPEDLEGDFSEAIDKMINLHLLKPIKKGKALSDPRRGGYYEDIGADGVNVVCHFTLNENYETEGTPIEEET